jgi:hypothetical protein
MGLSKNSKNQINKGGLLRLGGSIKRDKAQDLAGTVALKKRTRMDRTETRINKSRGGKRSARKKRSGKTKWNFPKRDLRKSKFNDRLIIFINIILADEHILSQ